MMMLTIEPKQFSYATGQAAMNDGNLLIVDDNPNNLQILHQILAEAGYKVRPALSGEIALRAIEAAIPDLILLDVRMAGMDGYQICKILKADPKTAGIPVIFISALQEVQDKLNAFQAGGVDYVSKPFQEAEVLARVKTHLQIHHLQKYLAYQNQYLNELVEIKAAQLATAEREASKRLDQIAHLNRSITSSIFSSAIAHDLRQPLAAILSNAEAAELFLQQATLPLQELKDIMADIRRDNQRASQIIDRMRRMLNKGESQVAICNLNSIVEEVLSFLLVEAKQRCISIVANVDPADFWVKVDAIQIQQVIVNMVLNSMEAITELDGAQRRIVLTTKASGDHAEFVVEDRGVGFGDNSGRVFESFFTTKQQGMGMGLAISASLIHAHQGQIGANNNPVGGAIVFFKLPLQSRESQ
jgi:signal transduction histidine kinase